MKRWYAVNTLPRQEVRAEMNLERQGYKTWLPTFKRSRRHARRIETVSTPVFPGYLFVQLDIEVMVWSPINGSCGVRRLLSQDGRPVEVATSFVSTLQRALEDEGSIGVFDKLEPGQQVRLLGGPFAGCVATLQRLASKDRVALLLNVLGTEVSTTVSRRMLAAAG